MTVEGKLDALRQLAAFKGVDENSLRILAEHGEHYEFARGHIIAREGQLGSGLFVILKGIVDVIQHGVVVDTSGPGDFVGELSVLDSTPRIATLVVREPVECLAIPSWQVGQIVERSDLAQVLREVEQLHRDREEQRKRHERQP